MYENCHRLARGIDGDAVMHVFFLCSDAHLNSQVILIIFSRRFSQNLGWIELKGLLVL